MKSTQSSKLWGGAFTKTPSQAVISFTTGRDVTAVPPADAALVPYDIWVNEAHGVMLAKTGIIPVSDAAKILQRLHALKAHVTKGKFILDPANEDVHTYIESWLTARLGIDVAGKLHTARSRNDQSVTDTRMYLRDQCIGMVHNSLILLDTLLNLAETYKAVPIPGFTHHQHAMVTTLGHVFLGWAAMVERDMVRFEQWFPLHNHNPLGNAASYGTSFPIDRRMTSAFLAFAGPDHNSLDAVTNRWEPEADFVSALSIHMNHLSQIAETLILFSTPEFGMVTIADSFSTGSSMMPQKKNPDPLEVIKGKAAAAAGQLMSLLSIGKGTFIGYNRDSQWTKYIVMDSARDCLHAPLILSGVLESIQVHADTMLAWSHKNFIGTTTLMEQLACQYNLPMRQAKEIVEHAVKMSGKSDQVTHAALTQALAVKGVQVLLTKENVAAMQSPHSGIRLSKSYGGPGKHSLKTTLRKLRTLQQVHERWLVRKGREQAHAKNLLSHAINSVVKGGE